MSSAAQVPSTEAQVAAGELQNALDAAIAAWWKLRSAAYCEAQRFDTRAIALVGTHLDEAVLFLRCAETGTPTQPMRRLGEALELAAFGVGGDATGPGERGAG